LTPESFVRGDPAAPQPPLTDNGMVPTKVFLRNLLSFVACRMASPTRQGGCAPFCLPTHLTLVATVRVGAQSRLIAGFDTCERVSSPSGIHLMLVLTS
jgi:hypothetical protein